MQLARGQASTTISEAKDAGPRGHNGTFVMIDSAAAVLGLVSAGIFLAHAIESLSHALVGAGARFTSQKRACSDVFSGFMRASRLAGVSCATMTWYQADSWR